MNTFYIGAAEGTRWPLGLDDVEHALEVRFPGIATRRGRALVAEQDYLAVDIPAGDTTIECLYADHFNFTMSDCEPAHAAEILAWLLALMSAGTATVAMSESNPRPVPLPEYRDQATLTAFLTAISA